MLCSFKKYCGYQEATPLFSCTKITFTTNQRPPPPQLCIRLHTRVPISCTMVFQTGCIKVWVIFTYHGGQHFQLPRSFQKQQNQTNQTLGPRWLSNQVMCGSSHTIFENQMHDFLSSLGPLWLIIGQVDRRLPTTGSVQHWKAPFIGSLTEETKSKGSEHNL